MEKIQQKVKRKRYTLVIFGNGKNTIKIKRKRCTFEDNQKH